MRLPINALNYDNTTGKLYAITYATLSLCVYSRLLRCCIILSFVLLSFVEKQHAFLYLCCAVWKRPRGLLSYVTHVNEVDLVSGMYPLSAQDSDDTFINLQVRALLYFVRFVRVRCCIYFI